MKLKLTLTIIALALLVFLSACDEEAIAKNPSNDLPEASQTTTPPFEQPPFEQPPVGEPPIEQPPFEQPNGEQPPFEQPPVGEQTPPPSLGFISEQSAKDKALSHAGVTEADVSLLKAEFDRDDGVDSYEIEFFVGTDEYEYDISAKSGEILKAEKNDISLLEPPSVYITAEQAKALALGHAELAEENIVGFKIELDTDDIIPKYELEWISGGFEYEYEIHAQSGEILKSEREID